MRIVGVGFAPNYVNALAPGDIVPDDTRFGVFWMPDSQVQVIYALDGTLLATHEAHDYSGSVACSAFDFDGDGAYELLWQDELNLWVIDGRTGETRIQWPLASGTAHEYPTIVDVDGDGSAEILFGVGARRNDVEEVARRQAVGHAPDVERLRAGEPERRGHLHMLIARFRARAAAAIAAAARGLAPCDKAVVSRVPRTISTI